MPVQMVHGPTAIRELEMLRLDLVKVKLGGELCIYQLYF
jgi:hypothetical protein